MTRLQALPATAGQSPPTLARWECRCQPTPILLGTHDGRGRVQIKCRDRLYRVDGTVSTVCPRCGRGHELNLTRIAQEAPR